MSSHGLGTVKDDHLPDSLPDAQWFRRLRGRLGRWFRRHGRDLPWRRTRDPYAVWLSEVMLQQTQVATVQRYFSGFLRRFPTIEALARARRQTVLRAWEGLGYYRRARQLHRAAQLIVEQHGGRLPQRFDTLCTLPGIGRYTAGAILSLAYDQPMPILEANTLRLWSRLLDCPCEIHSAPAQRLLWTAAAKVLPSRNPGRVNLALMDLGSLVCVSGKPRCEQCPVADLCRARAAGREQSLPRTRPRRRTTAVREAAVVLRRRGRILLLKRPEDQRWAGLWDFPRFELAGHRGRQTCAQLRGEVKDSLGMEVDGAQYLTTLRYSVTRFRVTVDCYEMRVVRASPPRSARLTMRWVLPGQMEHLPLTSPARRLVRMLLG